MKSFTKSLPMTFAALVVLALLIHINHEMATVLLRLVHDPLAEAGEWMVPMSTPVVLTAGDRQSLWTAREELRKLGITLPNDLPQKHPLLLDISWVQAANPYPPLLAEFNPDYGRSYFSFGYLGIDGRYHQLSTLSGETDTTPSLFIKKVRGAQTNWGDYYVEYVLLITKEVKPVPRVTDKSGNVSSWEKPAPTIDLATWGTYAGGGYDGFEEFGITAIAVLAELLLLAHVSSVFRFHRSRRRKDLVSSQPTPPEAP